MLSHRDMVLFARAWDHHLFNEVSSAIAPAVEALSVLTIFLGSILAVYRIFQPLIRRDVSIAKAKEVWSTSQSQ